MNDCPNVIVDNGTGRIKAGFAGEDAPRYVQESVVGIKKNKQVIISQHERTIYVGEEAMRSRGILKLEYPISGGKVKNWEHMEKVWHETYYNGLRIKPEDHNIMLTEAPLNPRENREKMVRIHFENFSAKGIYISIQAVLSLYSAGRTTGCVLDSGDGVTHTVPVTEGSTGATTIGRLDVAGRVYTEYFINLSQAAGNNFKSTAEKDIARLIKEEHCFVPEVLEETRAAYEKSPSELTVQYEMPDGQVINIGNERFEASQVLFDPSLIGSEEKGTSEQLSQSIMKSDVDLRTSLRANIIVSGGTTLTKGYETRVAYDQRATVPDSQTITVIAEPNRGYSVWIGGSVLSSLSSFESMWIKKSEYDETGASIVHRKCQ
ncbi:MAG: hypothetical protein MHMPM18_000039 [Marteilia pararefringens]